MNAKKVLGIVAACLILIFTGIIGVSSAANMNYSSVLKSTTGPVGSYYALVDVTGEIADYAEDPWGINQLSYHHQATVSYIEDLIYDDSNKGLLIHLNTPGGSAFTGVELYRAVLDYKEQTGRPVVATMGEMCASAGYYVASAADYIFADAETLTGSIGVYMAVTDVSGLYEKLGIKTVLVNTGDNKGAGAPGLPFTDDQKAVYQEVVNDTYERFVAAVAEGRSMTVAKVKPLADGRIFSANRALKEGLVDEIGSFDDAIDYMTSETGASLYYHEMGKQNVFNSLLSGLGSIMPKSESQVLEELSQNTKGGLMMLYGAN